MNTQKKRFNVASHVQRAKGQRGERTEIPDTQADQDLADWRDRAAKVIGIYAMNHGEFLIEDVVQFAAKKDFPEPPDPRAWGGAAVRAKALGYIEGCGYAPAKTSKGGPKRLWRRRDED